MSKECREEFHMAGLEKKELLKVLRKIYHKPTWKFDVMRSQGGDS
ncbi:hypothetical protein CGLO_15035 [Colletotrichum gloeosporioides Cg-14]|uniref:Uncharacterized protein n=1 Tax=Colletotrichum gloeosporioides (strain Cg-14) TaxID=1237896 RepID=T0JZQ3_COLGC|nr:hypothetical protein CGLO_15035 [Colletotrichum gloeosporioides Cg-14]